MSDQRGAIIRRILNIALSLSFIAAIWLPLTVLLIGLSTGAPLHENRNLAPMPGVPADVESLAAFPALFEAYYNDNFGMRKLLVRCLNSIRSRIPGVVVAGNVLVGDHGWFFNTQDKNIEDYRGLIRLSDRQLATIRDNLEERRRWMAAFGCRYLLVIAPSKWEIYPEYVPGNINRVNEISRLDQITDYLENNSKIYFISLREPLLEVKKKRLVYFKTDTHWNQYGAFIAVQEINKKLSELYPSVRVESVNHYEIEKQTSTIGNLASMMGLTDLEHSVSMNRKELRQPLREVVQDWLQLDNTLYSTAGDESNLPTAVFFHDSSGDKLRDLLPYSFSRCLFVWHYLPDAATIERIRPDIVIEEIGQRSMVPRLTKNPTGITGSFSSSSGKSVEVHYPPEVESLEFDARATKSLGNEQFIHLEINGKPFGYWTLTQKEQSYEVRIDKFTNPDDATILKFFYGYRPRHAVMFEGRSLPFHLKAETGGRNPNHCIVGINGLMMEREKGYNVYFLDASDPLFAEYQNFNTSWFEKAGREFSRYLRKTSRRKGFAVLVSRYFAGRRLTHGALLQMRRLGLKADLRKHPSWNHIALIDLSTGKPIDEKFGPGKQTLEIGKFDGEAGFFISNIKIEPELSPPPD